ncbi:MAG: zinc dependent phospholipase C family protein [Armatimonadetes bacterium]|nr:zinc dependent phospholipase C family protein [Armatimonadota bacterium]
MPTQFSVRKWVRSLAAPALVAALALTATTAVAWKPKTHMYCANQAIGLIQSDLDVVNINGTNYPVIPEVAAAIRAYPDFYRAGVCGPDAFPDIYVGQGFIHPDTRNDNGRSGNTLGDGHSYSLDWLRHIYQAGWSYYNSRSGNAEGQKILAFTYGFITHAAGDMWAHTFVNDWAGGVFPAISEVQDWPIAVRHIVVESYVGDATPTTDLSLVQNSQELAEFQLWAMMKGSDLGGFVDSQGYTAQNLGRGAIFDFFYDLRSDVSAAIAFLDPIDGQDPEVIALWIADPITMGLIYLNLLDWIDDIDEGLEAWAYMSQSISVDLFQNHDFDSAFSEVGDFIQWHLAFMVGVPDIDAYAFGVILEILSAFGNLIEPLADYALEFANYMLSQASGIDALETWKYTKHPANHINRWELGFAMNTSVQLDALMNRTSEGEPFDKNAFAPIYNTIQMSKLILLSPEALNQVLYDNRVGAIYSTGGSTDNENAMLGFIRTLDGHQQWRVNTARGYVNNPLGAQHGEGMPMWVDCLARDRVFRGLFKDWQNGNAQFPDLGAPTQKLSNTPNPNSSLTINGPKFENNGITYVGGGTTFTVDAISNYFWNNSEIRAEGQYLPLGTLSAGTTTTTFGPISGPDGVYNLNYQGIGVCPSGDDHAGALHNKNVTLDQTPPTIAVAPPAQNQVMDVNTTLVFDMTIGDAGSGVDSSSATLDGGSLADLATIDSFFLTAGDHTIVVQAADKLGNASSLTRIFSVHATIQGLKSAVNRAYSMGLITKPTTQTALQQHLNNAQKALDKGDKKTAANKVAAASQLVAGQLGNGVEPVFGQRFIGWCTDLIQRLGY